MGHRSTLTMQDHNQTWPDWFFEKYPQFVPQSGPLACRKEFKVYFYDNLFGDIRECQRDLISRIGMLRIVCLHECGGVMVVDLTHNAITAYDLGRDDNACSEEWHEHVCGELCCTHYAAHIQALGQRHQRSADA